MRTNRPTHRRIALSVWERSTSPSKILEPCHGSTGGLQGCYFRTISGKEGFQCATEASHPYDRVGIKSHGSLKWQQPGFFMPSWCYDPQRQLKGAGIEIPLPDPESSCSRNKWCPCRSISEGRFIIQSKKTLWDICVWYVNSSASVTISCFCRYKNISFYMAHMCLYPNIHYIKQNPQNHCFFPVKLPACKVKSRDPIQTKDWQTKQSCHGRIFCPTLTSGENPSVRLVIVVVTPMIYRVFRHFWGRSRYHFNKKIWSRNFGWQ